MNCREPLPADLRLRAFTSAEAYVRGISAGRLRSRDLVRVFHGVRAPSIIPTVRTVDAYAVRMLAREFYSHLTAALILGMRVPDDTVDRAVDVSVWQPKRAPRSRGIVGHALERPVGSRVVIANGYPVSDPVTTWCLIGTQVSRDQLIVAGDSLVRRQHPLATMEELHARVSAFTGRRGAKPLRAALTEVRAGTDSRRETILRLALTRAGLPEPAVNEPIYDPRGAQIALGDLVFRRYRVVTEYDGAQHRTDDFQFLRDVDRLNDIGQEKWQIVRINKSHMSNGAQEAIRRVRDALIAGGWRR